MQYKKVGFIDIDGVFRGKYIHNAKFKKSSSVGFCDVVFGWDSGDQVYGQDGVTGWFTGFPDGLLTFDTSTERELPWEKNVKFYLGDFSQDEQLKNVCPRTLLKDVLKAYHKLGLYPKVGFEFEWFNFRKRPQTAEAPLKHNLTKGMFGYSTLRLSENHDYVQQLLTDLPLFDIPIEGFHTETGPGVYEAAIQYRDALEAADQATLFKYAVKEIALKHDIIASFMAKWNAGLPGCGGHIHVSINDKDQNNILSYQPGTAIEGIPAHFLTGLLEGIAPLMAIYAPNINSYKRYLNRSWAPTSMSWGYQNRTTAVRLIPERTDSSHLEMRVPGTDVNPYLALYAILVSGLYGINEKLALRYPEQKGSAYENPDNPALPKSLEEAVRLMESHELPGKILNPTFLRHFLMTRKWEIQQHQQAVTDWEIKRYLEII